MKKSVKIIILVLTIVLLGVGLVYRFISNKNNANNTIKVNEDKVEFSKLYDVDENNVFEKISADAAIDLLEKGTGILYLGYPKCPWCQDLIPLLNKAAKDNNIGSIYYIEKFFDMRPDKVENPKYQEEYNKIIKYIDEYEIKINEKIKEDDIIKVPLVLFVKNGKIIGYQKGTISGHEITKNENGKYELRDLTDEEKTTIISKLNSLINKIYSNACSSGC
ncbi:MAG: hypothetical protein J6J17_02240 [Bacilli bacterium]|nr:hypothetical protein [Bacilli bacterium]